jgi:hypothetical protein
VYFFCRGIDPPHANLSLEKSCRWRRELSGSGSSRLRRASGLLARWVSVTSGPVEPKEAKRWATIISILLSPGRARTGRIRDLLSRTRFGPFFSLILISVGCLSNTACVSPMASGARYRAFALTDKELDRATAAGGATLSLDLLAFAEGSTAATLAQGSIRTGRTSILRIDVTPVAPAVYRAKLVGTTDADLVFASGSASATGDVTASCSAQARLEGHAAFFAQTSSIALTPTSAICACGALALSVPGL